MKTIFQDQKNLFFLDKEQLLSDVLSYQHPELVLRLQKKLNLSESESNELFNDTLRFLYLCGTNKGGLSPTKIIDEGWHNFILYTKDYREFCNKYFGKYIDHQPDSALVTTNDKINRATNTNILAVNAFGLLSNNWNFIDSADCNMDTNCQDPAPADCALNQ